MKLNFLLVTFIIVTASSCSSSYKTTQTPDDVYYSPLHLQTDNTKRDDQKNVYDNSASTTNDAEVRVRVHNRRYRRYDDYDYPTGGYYPYNNTYPVYRNPKYGSVQNQSQPKKTNLGAYKPNTTTPDSTVIFNPKLGTQQTGTIRTFGSPVNSSTNNGSGVGNFIRRVFSGDNNSYYNNSNRSNNTYTPGNNNTSSPSRTFDTKTSSSSSTPSSSSNTSSGSSSAPVRTFGKDKN